MTVFPYSLLSLLVPFVFLTVVALHLVKKSSTAIYVYMVQSIAVVLALILSSVGSFTALLVIALVASIGVKVVAAPYFFLDLVKKYNLTFLAETVCSLPLTLLILTGLVAFTRMTIFGELALLSPANADMIVLSLATILMSIFLIVNRRGAGSQMIGILSLENTIVLFALLAGLEQNSAFQLGITTNIFIWVIIASVLATIMMRHFHSLDTAAMKKLTD